MTRDEALKQLKAPRIMKIKWPTDPVDWMLIIFIAQLQVVLVAYVAFLTYQFFK